MRLAAQLLRLRRDLPRRLERASLYRSLARYAVLRSVGVPARFVMGVDGDGGDVDGHAWLEVDGEPWGETVDARFVEAFAYPARVAASWSS
jgi:hypothetical protein